MPTLDLLPAPRRVVCAPLAALALTALTLGCASRLDESVRGASPALAARVAAAPLPPAGEPVDLAAVSAIRAEGLGSSKIMDTLYHLTDLHGPRLTNSPMQRRAAAWAVERLTEFGLSDARQEPWGEFGLGWSFERCVIEMTAPAYLPMIAIPKAWTLGTDGVISGEPVLIDARTAEQLEKYRGKLAGRIVLNGAVRDVNAHWDPQATRYDDAGLEDLLLRGTPDPEEAAERDANRSDWARRRELSSAVRALLKEEVPALLIEADSGRRNDYGVILLGSGGSYDPAEDRGPPAVVVSVEQYQRMARLIQHGETVEMRAEVVTSFYDEDTVAANVVAELPGADPELAEQVVMLGAHFDSWHPATGATDNGASCAVVMEAARILASLPTPPRRTVRVALWTGEEQGLKGSSAYVKNHFGERKTMELTDEHGKLSAYFNLDNGAGRIRGVYCEENAAIVPIFRAWLEPFADLDADTLTLRGTGSTDHRPFDSIGLPGFQFIQDPMDYGSRTHHTNMDTYERVVEDDVMRSAVILASFAWHAANRDELLPRKLPPKGEPVKEEAPVPAASDEKPAAVEPVAVEPVAAEAGAPATPAAGNGER